MISILTGMSTGKGAFDSDWEVSGAVWQEDSGERESKGGWVTWGKAGVSGRVRALCNARLQKKEALNIVRSVR